MFASRFSLLTVVCLLSLHAVVECVSHEEEKEEEPEGIGIT